MSKPLRAILPLGLALYLSALSASGASPVPPAPHFLVLDETGLLSPPQLKALETLLIEHNQATGEQLMVGVFKDLGDETADRRTHEVFEVWLTQSGLSGKGALLAVFAQQKKGHLESGYGLPALDENSNHAVTHDFLEPELREGHPFRAVGLSILELLRIDGSPLIESGRAAGLLREGGLDGSFQPTQGAAFGFTSWLIFALLSLLVLLLVINNLLAAEAHFTGEGWYRPNPWKLLSPTSLKEMLTRTSKQDLKKAPPEDFQVLGNQPLRGNAASDPIVRALALAEAGTTAEIRVHLSRRLWERDPFRKAQKIFERFGMTKTRQRNAVLLYVNLRRHRFAVLGDQGVDQRLGQVFWKELTQRLSDELRSTDPERAIARTIESLGQTLRRHFPENMP